jgi:hypothetical protein
MMIGPNKPPRLQSWIPPSFAWTTATGVFSIEVGISDPDVVEFVSTGVREITVHGTKKTAQTFAAMIGKDKLSGQFEEAVWMATLLRPAGSQVKAGMTINAYCHAVFLLPGEKRLCVVVGRTKPNSQNGWISARLPVTCRCWSRSIRQSDGVIQNNPKARANPKALAQLGRITKDRW